VSKNKCDCFSGWKCFYCQGLEWKQEEIERVRRPVIKSELPDFGFGAELYKRMRNPETFHAVMMREIDFDRVKQEVVCE